MHLDALIVFVIVFGAVSVQDYRRRRISNRLIALGLLAALAMQARRLGLPIDPLELRDAVIHNAAGAALGVGFWLAGVWPAGDAKLFILVNALARLIPAAAQIDPRVFAILILANAFTPAAAVVVVRTALHVISDPARLKGAYAGWRAPAAKRVIVMIVYGLFLGLASRWAVAWAARFLPQKEALFLVLGLVALLAGPIRLLLLGSKMENYTIVGTALLCLALLAAGGLGELWARLRQGASLGVMLVLANQFLIGPLYVYLDEQETQQVPAGALESAMVLSDRFKEKFALASDADAFGPLRPDGLTTAQAETVREWCRRKSVAVVEVYRTYPFAFWICLGAALTLACRQDVVSWLLARRA